MALITVQFPHEFCTCGHCRCQHHSGYLDCKECPCERYTWPGDDCRLPEDHLSQPKEPQP